jgi:hypothetical protein
MGLRKEFPILLLIAAVAFGAGCASVSTVPAEGVSNARQVRRPAKIWVRPFATNDGMWLKDTAEPEQRAMIQDWLTGSLLRHLPEIAPTFLLEDEPPDAGWLVSGRFLRVDPGSRTGRLFFGSFGAGASKLETRVNVYDLAVSPTEPILTFTTTGGSNLAVGLHGAMNSTDDDVDRTAREILGNLEAHLQPAGSE